MEEYIFKRVEKNEVYDCGDDGTMIYLAEKSLTVLLNWMSALILDQCTGKPFEEICSNVLDKVSYSQDDAGSIGNDIREHIEELIRVGLVKRIKGGSNCVL